MSDYRFVKSPKELDKIISEIKSRGGIVPIKINNQPKEFPVVLTYSLSNTIEGIIANIKHISPKKILSLIDEG